MVNILCTLHILDFVMAILPSLTSGMLYEHGQNAREEDTGKNTPYFPKEHWFYNTFKVTKDVINKTSRLYFHRSLLFVDIYSTFTKGIGIMTDLR